jgi:hypothetical protein
MNHAKSPDNGPVQYCGSPKVVSWSMQAHRVADREQQIVVRPALVGEVATGLEVPPASGQEERDVVGLWLEPTPCSLQATISVLSNKVPFPSGTRLSSWIR